jgi:ADP-ribose pyrophosphatase YjhB (NUDIX family)
VINNNHEKFKVTQSAFVTLGDRMLILKHKSGRWILPGGRLNINEAWSKSLAREILEETGITDFDIKAILEVDNWELNEELYYGVFFHVLVDSQGVKLSDEHIEFLWITKKEIGSYEFWNSDLKKRIERLAKVII